MTFGYVRVSTVTQNEKRQIENIKAKYPDAVIMVDKCTGTNMNRPAWSKLMKNLKAGDVVVFDEISRMSRNAAEGFQVYQELYEKGVELIFLKESTLNTENFRNVAQVELTGTDVDAILKGINEYLMKLAENQIKAAFDTAQHEVDFLR
ncbi:MAG: recombinase family protein, partial [Mogibacterium sp.]|nr:recombinase family protein [Mogibacterium sp.]